MPHKLKGMTETKRDTLAPRLGLDSRQTTSPGKTKSVTETKVKFRQKILPKTTFDPKRVQDGQGVVEE